ncbi:MAG: glycerol-3-phosphate 1-O-acyltransferase PlsY [Planctomycetes bacterium]|nr:glycerol-3-phosphate 1-O-acyltransferase PlsY [Planctomycetota bacterium]
MTAAAIIGLYVVAAYLAGSVPFGWLIGKARGMDIREHGSKNIGATNCWRVCGWPYGLAAFVLDVAKGFVPGVLLVHWWPAFIPEPFGDCPYYWEENPHWLFVVPVAAAPIVGHVFPVWLRLKGGKAVATSLGVLLALPMLRWLAVAAFGAWVVTVLITRYVSVASSVAAAAFGAAYLYVERKKAWEDDYLAVTVFVLLLVAVVLVRHKSNYVRLWKGTENKLWGKK